MNVTFALAQKTAAALGKYGRNFGNNRKRNFFGCFAANVESGWREQGSAMQVEIEQSMFAEPRQQLCVTFSWS